MFYRSRVLRCLLPLFILLTFAAAVSAQEARIASVRTWEAAPGKDTLADARAALAKAVPAHGIQFEATAGQPTWFAIEVEEDAEPVRLVLELTHPSIRSALLYTEHADDDAPPAARGGRDIPADERSRARFPAALELPVAAVPAMRTFYLRLQNTVTVNGSFLLQTRDDWADASLELRLLQTLSFVVALLAALYSALRAVRLRTWPWAYFAILCVCASGARILVSGYGESWLWPGLTPWRGPLVTTMVGICAGMVMLLFRGAFSLEVTAPAYSRWLLVLGLACPIVGVAAMLFDSPVQQAIAQLTALTAIITGMISIGLAWRTANRVALWLLGGFAPVAVSAAVTGAATAGVMPFEPWMLMAVPIAAILEMPLNLRGLYLLEKRRNAVIKHRSRLTRDAGPDGETRLAMSARLMRAWSQARHAPATLMLLRFEGLAPGAAAVREVDEVNVEHYMHAMMEFAVQTGNLTGRWSHHEIPLLRLKGPGGVTGLVTALFAQALRSESSGIRSRDVSLRIAYSRFDGDEVPLADTLAALTVALDDPDYASQRRLELDVPSGRTMPLNSRPSSSLI